jgi:hypothetical protein
MKVDINYMVESKVDPGKYIINYSKIYCGGLVILEGM